MRTQTHRAGRPRPGFTLVEILTVVVILGILAAMITGATLMALKAGRQTAIRIEISQLQMALERYKAEVGEYPPDFFGINSSSTAIQTAARNEVSRHILKRFPQYDYTGYSTAYDAFAANMLVPVASGGYGIDVTGLDPASALAFWLGGLPDLATGDYVPAGFNQDPEHPFKTGGPRTKSYFDGFKSPQFVWAENDPYDSSNTRYLRFYPVRTKAPLAAGATAVDINDNSPYVYFKARRVGARYEYGYSNSTILVPAYYVHGVLSPSAKGLNVAVPYLEKGTEPYWSDVPTGLSGVSKVNDPPHYDDVNYLQHLYYIRRWRDREKFQIICAGLGGQFGDLTSGTDPATTLDVYRFRFTITGDNFTADQADDDNLSSFTDKTLENELK